MHTVVRKIVVMLSLGSLLAPFAFAAKTVEQAYVESYQGATNIPVPVEVVAPQVSAQDGGMVQVAFVVNAQGKPTDITVKAATDNHLIRPVVDAVSKWKFTPLVINGEPVARKVELPVRFVSAE